MQWLLGSIIYFILPGERTEQGRDVIGHWAAVVHSLMLHDLCTTTEGAGAATLKHWCGGLSVLSFAVIFSSRVTEDSDCLVIAKTCSDITVNPRYYGEVTFQVEDSLMLGCTQCFVFSILQEVIFYAECTTTALLCKDIFLFGFVAEQPLFQFFPGLLSFHFHFCWQSATMSWTLPPNNSTLKLGTTCWTKKEFFEEWEWSLTTKVSWQDVVPVTNILL